MNVWKKWVPMAAVLLFAGQINAQSNEERELEREQKIEAYAERLRVAEQEMAEAARRVAELTSERLPQIEQFEQSMKFLSGKPRIGITIDGDEDSGAVEGVEVKGVSPGSAADDAGLRTGDILTSVNGETLTAENSMAANRILFEFMEGVEDGDELLIEYLRNGNQGSVELSPRAGGYRTFAWAPHVDELHIERIPGLAALPDRFEQLRMSYGFPWSNSGLGSMEIVELSEGLGRYFGTDSGLLVVSAPESQVFGLQDGDVIVSIDGREPKDVRHALRILSSYQSGEKLKLNIMRDKRKQTLDVEIPEKDHLGMHRDLRPAPRPVRAPTPPKPENGTAAT